MNLDFEIILTIIWFSYKLDLNFIIYEDEFDLHF